MLEVVALTPALAGDFLALFDRAFPDNPGWSGCYCRFYQLPETPWDSSPAASERHRADAAAAIAAGQQPGFLAYAGGAPGRPGARAVGWLSAGPVAAYANPRGYDEKSGGAEAWTTCFVVEPPARGQGVADALLRAALADFRARGIASVEAFSAPAREPGAAEQPAASSGYKGTLAMYLRHGFRVEAEVPGGRVRMRVEL